MFNPAKVISSINIQKGQVVADFGAGSGFFVIEAAKQVGPDGVVYAIDILEEPLEVISAKANALQIFNIKPIKSDLESEKGSTLEPASCDLVIISNILFQIKNPQRIIKEAERILKQNGRVLIIDWYPEKMISKEEHSPLTPEEIKQLAEKNNLKLLSQFEPGPTHYGLLFQKIST